MDTALAQPLLEQPQAIESPAEPSSKPPRTFNISSANAAELAKKAAESRKANHKLYLEQLELAKDIIKQGGQIAPLIPETIAPIADELLEKPANALGLIQTHGKEQLATNILPDQEKRVAELNAQLDGINRLIDKATEGNLVVGYDHSKDGEEDKTELVFASPRDIQALSKARRDILEMLFRIHGVLREPIAKTPTGNTKRNPFNMQVE